MPIPSPTPITSLGFGVSLRHNEATRTKTKGHTLHDTARVNSTLSCNLTLRQPAGPERGRTTGTTPPLHCCGRSPLHPVSDHRSMHVNHTTSTWGPLTKVKSMGVRASLTPHVRRTFVLFCLICPFCCYVLHRGCRHRVRPLSEEARRRCRNQVGSSLGGCPSSARPSAKELRGRGPSAEMMVWPLEMYLRCAFDMPVLNFCAHYLSLHAW